MRRTQALSLVVLITLTAAALKLWLALTTYGTSDVWYWEVYLATTRELGAIALYHTDEHFNHPPFTTHALLWLGALADLTRLPFPFWLRLPAIVADVVSVALAWRLLTHWRAVLAEPEFSRARAEARPLTGSGRTAMHVALLSLALLAAAPASVMVSGFHGNTDPVVMCFVLLAIVFWELRRRTPLGAALGAALAGAAFGMALNVKVIPLIFLPAFFLYLGGWWRLLFLTCAALAVFAGSMPYLLQDPNIIAQKVLGYGSYYGHWGLSRLLFELAPSGGPAAQLDSAFQAYGRYVALGLPALAALLMNVPHIVGGWSRPPLYVQCGLATALFLVVTPGFGPQYIAWLVPWVPAAGAAIVAACYAVTGLFLFLVYDYWAGHFPWHTADARPYEFDWWPRAVVNVELIAWASVLLVAGALAGLAASYLRRPVSSVR